MANPLFSLIGAILSKVRREGATITLIAPLAPWFPDLLNLLCEQPFILPDWKRYSCQQGCTQVPLCVLCFEGGNILRIDDSLKKNQKNMRNANLCLFLVCILSVNCNEEDFESLATELSIQNFDDIISQYSKVLVEFYAPW
jgi:hypothetical protein